MIFSSALDAIAINTIAAGFVVAATPGPAVLALIGLGAVQGRIAAAKFLAGHFIGDALWASLALLTLASAQLLPAATFVVLALICAGYLGWLGLRAILVRPREGKRIGIALNGAWRPGLMLGLSNPKSYPLAVALLTVALGPKAIDINLIEGATLIGFYLLGFLLGDLFDIWLVGSRWMANFYRRHDLNITRVTGLLFLLFAVDAGISAFKHN